MPLTVSRNPVGGQGLATAMPTVEGCTNKGGPACVAMKGARAHYGVRQTQRDHTEHRCLRGDGDTV